MDPDTTFSLPSLLCEEDESSLNEIKLDASLPKSEDDRYIRSLIETESKSNDYGCVCISDDDNSRNWFKCARLDAINWIFSVRSSLLLNDSPCFTLFVLVFIEFSNLLQTREILGFQFRTAYLSLTYFDRFISRRFIDVSVLASLKHHFSPKTIIIPVSVYCVQQHHFVPKRLKVEIIYVIVGINAD